MVVMGGSGGQFLEIIKKNKINVVCGESRVDNTYDVENEIATVNPTHVVSFIGRTHGKIGDKVYKTIDYLEESGKLLDNVRDNLYGPMLLADICKKKKIILHI